MISFAQAIELAKSGKKIRRSVWNTQTYVTVINNSIHKYYGATRFEYYIINEDCLHDDWILYE